MKKVLVAGATGYLGRFVAQEFKNQGYWVRALARNPEKMETEGPYFEPSLKNVVDDVFIGEITDPGTLQGVCDGIDVVFSSIGITLQKDKVTFQDVDYQGNMNLLDMAKASSVKKFIFVSVFNAALLKDLEIVKAREMFVSELKKSGMDYTVIRPTGFFSDLTEVLKMASSGRVYLIGSGQHKINPIHGADLAKASVASAQSKEHEIPIGGPKVYTFNDIAQIAFATLNKPPRITRIPSFIVKVLLKVIQPFNKHVYNLLAFITTGLQMDNDAPTSGTHLLEQYYQQFHKNRMDSK